MSAVPNTPAVDDELRKEYRKLYYKARGAEFRMLIAGGALVGLALTFLFPLFWARAFFAWCCVVLMVQGMFARGTALEGAELLDRELGRRMARRLWRRGP